MSADAAGTVRPPFPILWSSDHKDVGTRYMLLAVVAGLVGGGLSLVLRLPALLSGRLTADAALWHMIAVRHGPIMIFFAAIPALVGGLGNWFVPLLIGAHRTAFPRLGAWSFWLTAAGFAIAFLSLLGGDPVRWPILLPMLASLHLVGIAIVLGAANLVATILNLRQPDARLGSLPIFVWSQLIANGLILAAMPVLLGVLTVLALGRPGLNAAEPLDHLFALFGAPGFCIMILPGFGLVGQIVSTLAGRRLAGTSWMVWSMAVLALLGFLGWARPLLHDGLPAIAAASRLIPMLAIVLPGIVMAACCAVTLRRAVVPAALPSSTAGLFAASFLALVAGGGVLELLLALDRAGELSTARLHAVLSIGAVFAMLAGFYYWIGKMTGRACPERLGRLQFWTLAGGCVMTMLPFGPLPAFGAAMTSLSVLLFALLAGIMLFRWQAAPANPWGDRARTLEWSLPSPVPRGLEAGL